MLKKTVAYQYLERTPHNCLSSVDITIVEQDCLEIAQAIQAQHGSVCVLNLANQFHVGGDYLNLSAMAQEESIIRRTDLLDSLIQLDGVTVGNISNPYKYSLPDCLGFDNAYQRSGFGEFTSLYSEDIDVFYLDIETKEAIIPFKMNVISSAAYNLSFIEESPSPDLYIVGTVLKIINQCRTAKLHGQKHLVLGAFGCGAFQNYPYTIAEIYRAVLNEYEFQGCFDSICFAITNKSPSINYTAFSKTFHSACSKTLFDILKDAFALQSTNPFLAQKLPSFYKIDTPEELVYVVSNLIDTELGMVPRVESEKKIFLTHLREQINADPQSATAILSDTFSRGDIYNYYISSAFFKGKSYFTLKLEKLLLRMSITTSKDLNAEDLMDDWATDMFIGAR